MVRGNQENVESRKPRSYQVPYEGSDQLCQLQVISKIKTGECPLDTTKCRSLVTLTREISMECGGESLIRIYVQERMKGNNLKSM